MTDREERTGWRGRRVAWAAVAAAGVAGIVIVLVWFQPQTLLFDDVIDDEFPGAQPDDATPPAQAPTTDAGTTDPGEEPGGADQEVGEGGGSDPGTATVEAPGGPRALSTGSFASRSRYTVSGTATVFELEDGSRTLRLEGFESTNGPDLFVYLTAADSADSDPELDADFVDLGVLRGNVGNQNYEITAGVDLDRYDTAVIWCRRFSVGFGAADLAKAG